MDGTTYYYTTAEREYTSQIAIFGDYLGRYQEDRIMPKMRGHTQVMDRLGRKVCSYWFGENKKWVFEYDTPSDVIDQQGYRMHGASWLDKNIMGYDCAAYFIRDKTAFSPTYVFWVCRHADLPEVHPLNLRYPKLPGFVMGYSWSAKRTYTLLRVSDGVDDQLFSDVGAEPIPENAKFVQEGFSKVLMPLVGNRIFETAQNLVRLFGG